jgi:choline dehydrogenase
LRVHGIEGPRVSDASVMPAVTSTNPDAPTVMSAEKGATLIKGAAR